MGMKSLVLTDGVMNKLSKVRDKIKEVNRRYSYVRNCR